MDILLTTAYNLDCDYCFAQSLRERPGPWEMKLRELEWLFFDMMNLDVDEMRFMAG